jgi:hypothetical protein
MGVDDLFPVIAPAMEKVNYFEALNGRTVAEDGFVWLHKDATFSALGLIWLPKGMPAFFLSILRENW